MNSDSSLIIHDILTVLWHLIDFFFHLEYVIRIIIMLSGRLNKIFINFSLDPIEELLGILIVTRIKWT